MDDPSVVSDENWDGFPPVNSPTIPYVGSIPGGVKPGKTIQVQGQIAKNATKFSINLQSGENSLPYADAAFHFSPRFEDVVVRNTRTNGEWGQEERNQISYPIPFARGENFQLVIQCESEKYKMYVNGKHYVDYKHRLPMGEVDFISFKMDVEIKAIRYGKGRVEDFIKTTGNGTMENNTVENNHTDLPSTPFAQAIPERLQHGTIIYISGYIPPTARVFSINLQKGDEPIPAYDCALHITPRFNSHVLCNTMIDEMWGSAETTEEVFPFVRGSNFDVKIQCRNAGYKVWVDGKPLLEYSHRIEDLDRINCLSIEGNVEVNRINFTQEDPDQIDEAEEEEEGMEEEEEGMDADEGGSGDQTTQNIEQESVSVNSAEERQSIDSTRESSEKDEGIEQEIPSGEAEASPQEGSPTEISTQEDSATGQEQTDSPQENLEQKTLKSGAEKAPSSKDSVEGALEEGEPDSKRMKLGDGQEEEEGEESGAESDDSEKKDGDFDVERILTRRKGPDGDEYLLKWAGWSLYDCTWEPEANVSRGVKRAFNKPVITKGRLVASADTFYESIQSHLTGSKGNEQMRLRIEHDILRSILSDRGRPQDKSDPSGWRLYNKSELQAWELPDNWWYRLDKKGHGKQVSFPIRMKIQLDWTPLSYVMDKHRKLIPAKRKPLELLLVQMKKREYSI